MDTSHPSDEQLILLGTHDTYIHAALFSPSSKTLRLSKSTTVNPHPSWLAFHPSIPGIFYSNGHRESRVFLKKLKGSEGDFDAVSEIESSGEAPTHLEVLLDGSAIVVAHYNSGNATYIPLLPDGEFDTSKAPVHFTPSPTPSKHPRQDGPHVHQVIPLQDGSFLIPDLGGNKLVRLKYVDGKLELQSELKDFEDHDGPRHAVLHPDGTCLYTLCELSSTLVTQTYPEGKTISRHSILPPADSENGPKMLASEVVLLPPLPGSKSDKYLLIASNRDSPNPEGDGIALFSVSKDGRRVERTKQAYITGLGKHLRGVAVDKSGKYLAVAGRDGGGLVIYERTGDEGLELVELAKIEVDNVVCPLWV